MALTFGNTNALGGAVKCLCYAPAGAGKTMLCATAPAPLIISAENGLLSIRQYGIPYIEVATMQDFRDAYTFVAQSADAASFQTICIDSISDIAESALTALKLEQKDPRRAYGELADEMMIELRQWRHLPGKHVYITCKQARLADEAAGSIQFAPAMPGRQLNQQMPYWGDELFALRIIPDADNKPQRRLQTQPDMQYYAKDRSGRLDLFEPPHLTQLFSKIGG